MTAVPSEYRRDRVAGGSHPGADQPVPVPLGPRPRVPTGPADSRGTPLEAFPQPGAGPRMAGIRVGVGDVAQPELDRVDAEFAGEFVHRALQGDDAERFPWSTSEGGRHRIAADQPMDALEGRAGIQPR